MYNKCIIIVHMSIFSTKDEESTYKALLQSPGVSVVSLATTTKIHRPKLYAILEQLVHEGLVETFMTGKRTLYRTTSRETLQKKIEKEKAHIDEEAKVLLALADDTQTVKIINSKQDVINLFDTMTKTLGARGDYYSFTTKTESTSLGKESLEIFRKNRDNKDLWSHVLTDKPIDMKKGVRFNLEIKHLGNERFEQNCLWLTYADTYAFVDYENETGYIIKNKRLAKFQQEVFKYLYKKI